MLDQDERRKLPVSGSYDVIVIGGGPAGFSAGFAAARAGMKTLIVEQFNSLGGIAGAAGHGCIARFTAWQSSELVVSGIIYESIVRLHAAGECELLPAAAFFEVEGYKRLLDEMALECGCHLLYYTQFADAVVEDGALREIVIQNKSGRTRLQAKVFVDATGDGDVAAKAGVPFSYGGPDGDCQAMTLMFTIGGVDWEKVSAFRKLHGSKMEDVWKAAQDAGDMRPFQREIMGWWHTRTSPRELNVNFTHINHLSALKAEDLTAATIEGRRQAYETIRVYRKYVPGMEHCYMVATPASLGVRESRRIHGLYCLTEDDVKSQCVFEDSIGYGASFIDIHGRSGPGMDQHTWFPPKNFKYQLPFRILVPQGLSNLLVAGRCVSVTHQALGSVRFMSQCGVTGEAAGTAAVLSIRSGRPVPEIDTSELQALMRQNGCIVTADDIRGQTILDD